MGRVKRFAYKCKKRDNGHHKGKDKVVDVPPDNDTQPLPNKLRQLMSNSDDRGSRDKPVYNKKDTTHEATEHVSCSRKRHLQQWKQKHKMKKKRQKDNKNDKIFYQDLVKFGEVVDRPPELPGKSKGVKLCHLTFMRRT